MTLGGMRIPRVPDAASAPVAKRRSYPKRSISGITIAPMVATVAMLEPVTAPNAPQARTEVMAIPPGIHPIHARRPSYNSVANPVWKTSCPMRTNSGIVTRTKLRASSHGTSAAWAMAAAGPSRTRIPRSPAAPIAKAMGTPRRRRKSRRIIAKTPTVVSITAPHCRGLYRPGSCPRLPPVRPRFAPPHSDSPAAGPPTPGSRTPYKP